MKRTQTPMRRADTVTVLGFGLAAAILAVAWAIRLASETFRPGGIAWRLPVDATTSRVHVTAARHIVHGIADSVVVTAHDVNAVSVTMIAASVVASGLIGLVAVCCGTFLAWNVLRHRIFAPETIRAWNVLGFTLAVGGGVIMFCDTLGGNGVLAALGLTDTGIPPSTHTAWDFAPFWAAGAVCVLIGAAFRRAMHLQSDLDGLV